MLNPKADQLPIADGISQQKAVEEITDSVFELIGNPISAWAVAATLESLGIRDIDAQTDYGYASVFELGEEVYSKIKARQDEVMYPLFQEHRNSNLRADTLMKNEIRYLGYEEKKEFYKSYPLFFTKNQKQQLKADYRKNESVKASVFGEYKDDNFNNRFIRGGISADFGNRRTNNHTIKTEYLNFSDTGTRNLSALTYQGVGYEFSHRKPEKGFQFQTVASLLAGEEDFVPEGKVGVSFSKDSIYTSIELSGGSELTSTAIKKNYYQSRLQLYRQDYWFKNKWLSTAASASGKYYTNNVFRYEAQLRAFLELMESKFRLRPVAEASYSDATRSFTGGIPYYTPDKYFSKGVGIDVQYRNPVNFDYKTRFTAEVLAKHEQKDGMYVSGRAAFEHQFANFWEISLGTDFSTSKVYRSNRVFFGISYYFPKKLIQK